MHPEFWQQRWQEGRTGFHQATPTPLMMKYWPSFGVLADARVFVPLAGKSNDMVWLAAQGHRVLGVELAQMAVDQFFAEHALTPAVHETRYGKHHIAGNIELICGDVFHLDTAILESCTAVFDRAAMIALPPELRQRYIQEVYAKLPSGCHGLLITLEYPQQDRDGPPFSVQETEVRAQLEPVWQVHLQDRRPIPADHPGFVAGASKLDTAVYKLIKTDAFTTD